MLFSSLKCVKSNTFLALEGMKVVVIEFNYLHLNVRLGCSFPSANSPVSLYSSKRSGGTTAISNSGNSKWFPFSFGSLAVITFEDRLAFSCAEDSTLIHLILINLCSACFKVSCLSICARENWTNFLVLPCLQAESIHNQLVSLTSSKSQFRFQRLLLCQTHNTTHELMKKCNKNEFILPC